MCIDDVRGGKGFEKIAVCYRSLLLPYFLLLALPVNSISQYVEVFICVTRFTFRTPVIFQLSHHNPNENSSRIFSRFGTFYEEITRSLLLSCVTVRDAGPCTMCWRNYSFRHCNHYHINRPSVLIVG